MKEQTVYTCEFCLSKYDKKEEALECENKHTVVKIVDAKYYKNIQHPIALYVKDAKGNESIYTNNQYIRQTGIFEKFMYPSPLNNSTY